MLAEPLASPTKAAGATESAPPATALRTAHWQQIVAAVPTLDELERVEAARSKTKSAMSMAKKMAHTRHFTPSPIGKQPLVRSVSVPAHKPVGGHSPFAPIGGPRPSAVGSSPEPLPSVKEQQRDPPAAAKPAAPNPFAAVTRKREDTGDQKKKYV